MIKLINLMETEKCSLLIEPANDAGVIAITVSDGKNEKRWHFNKLIVANSDLLESYARQMIREFKRGLTE